MAENRLDEFRVGLGFQLDSFQVDACQALESGRDVLVAAPTGAGKTVVGEFSVYMALRQGGKAFYTTPIKALSNQKYVELARAYGASKVGLLTGDLSLNPDGQILVMTTEVLRNMLYAGSPALDDLAYVVLDEVHYLADRLRGAAWEEVIIHMPLVVRLVCLSATISNAEEFGAWLGTVRNETVVVVSEERPVPLFQHLMVGSEIFDLFDDRKPSDETGKYNPRAIRDDAALNHELLALSEPASLLAPRSEDLEQKRGRSRQFERQWDGYLRATGKTPWAQTLKRLSRARLLPAIIFVFSRTGCEAAVRSCVASGLWLTSVKERREIIRRVDLARFSLSSGDLQAVGFEDWREGLRRGIAAHHAGLLPAFKEVIESLFAEGLLKVVFATETLALGINMPARSVVLERLEKFNGETRVPLTAGEYTQLTGRAGRRGHDEEGHAVVLWRPGVDPAAVAALASRRTYPLISSFRPTYNMSANLISRLGRDASLDLLHASFAQFQTDNSAGNQQMRLRPEVSGLRLQEEDQPDGSVDELDRRGWDEPDEGVLDLPTSFGRVIEVLTHYGYLESAGTDLATSGRGDRLRKVYGERDLLTCLVVDAGIFDDLSPAELAALSTVLVYRSSRRVPGSGRKMPTPELELSFRKIMNIWTDLSLTEERQMLPPTAEPEGGLAHAMYAWASGGNLSEVLLMVDTSAGTFVHWVRRNADLLRQLSKASNAPQGNSDPYAEALHLIDRGVAAQATPGHLHLPQPPEPSAPRNSSVQPHGSNKARGRGT